MEFIVFVNCYGGLNSNIMLIFIFTTMYMLLYANNQIVWVE